VNADPSVVDRVTNLTSLTNGLFQVGDDDASINVGLVSLTQGIPAGGFARVRFDCTPGASISTAGFSCVAVGSDDQGLEVAVSCALSLATP
jgi:hypothetical protein